MNRDRARSSVIGDLRILSELSFYGCQQGQAVSPLNFIKKRTIFSKTENEEAKSTVNTKINIDFWV
jgi:hypothetical protein